MENIATIAAGNWSREKTWQGYENRVLSEAAFVEGYKWGTMHSKDKGIEGLKGVAEAAQAYLDTTTYSKGCCDDKTWEAQENLKAALKKLKVK